MFKRGDLVRSKDQNFLPWTGIVLERRDFDGEPHVQVRRTKPNTLGHWVIWESEEDVYKAGQ